MVEFAEETEAAEGTVQVATSVASLDFSTVLLGFFSSPRVRKSLNPVVMDPILFRLPTDAVRFIFSMLSFADISRVGMVNKACQSFVTPYYASMKLSLQSQRQIIDGIEQKKRNKERKNQADQAEIERKEGLAYAAYQATLLEIARERKELQQTREEELKSSITPLFSHQQRGEDELFAIQQQIAQLEQFVADAKKEKGNKYWFSHRIIDIHNPSHNLHPNTGTIFFFQLTVAILLKSFGITMLFEASFFLSTGMILPATYTASMLAAGLVWSVISVGLLLIGLSALLVLFSWDCHGEERFDSALLSCFSKAICDALSNIKNLYSLSNVYDLYEMPTNISDDQQHHTDTEVKASTNDNAEQLFDAKVYVEIKKQSLKYKVAGVEHEVTSEVLAQIVGTDKAKKILALAESKQAGLQLKTYKSDILKVISKNGHIPENDFDDLDVKKVTFTKACEIVEAQRDFLQKRLAFFQPKTEAATTLSVSAVVEATSAHSNTA